MLKLYYIYTNKYIKIIIFDLQSIGYIITINLEWLFNLLIFNDVLTRTTLLKY